MKKNKSRKINKLLIIATSVFLCYSFVNFTSIYMQINKKNQEIKALSSQIEEQEIENNMLIDIIEDGVTDEAVSQVAKDKLGFIFPGERIIVDIGSK